MIKIDRTHQCKSMWNNNEVYDIARTKSLTVKIFGVTIYKRTEDFKSDGLEVNKSKI